MIKYFKVTCKAGHVGKRYYIPIDLYIKASSGEEAAALARREPRVKHHHKDAIQGVLEVNKKEFRAGKKRNSKDPYFMAHSKQEQNRLADLSDRLVEDPHFVDRDLQKRDRHNERVQKRKEKKQRNVKQDRTWKTMKGLYQEVHADAY